MRCFVAAAISTEAKGFLERFMTKAGPAFPAYRFTAAQNLHITLQFVGDVDRARIPDLSAALHEAVSQLPRFTVGIGEAGSFSGRILHVSIEEGKEALSRLAVRVVGALGPLGFHPDKPFVAHITLGRSRDRGFTAVSGDTAAMWRAAFRRSIEEARQPINWEIPEVILMESVLGPKGPTYIPRGVSPLSR